MERHVTRVTETLADDIAPIVAEFNCPTCAAVVGQPCDFRGTGRRREFHLARQDRWARAFRRYNAAVTERKEQIEEDRVAFAFGIRTAGTCVHGVAGGHEVYAPTGWSACSYNRRATGYDERRWRT
jgi:hypothetical protein